MAESVPHGLNEQQLGDLRSIFDAIDTDGNGTLEPTEIGEVMKELGMYTTDEALTQVIQQVDDDGNGVIEFEEFVQIISNQMDPMEEVSILLYSEKFIAS